MWRVTIGAVLSIVDLVTDVIVLKEFYFGGEKMSTYFRLSLGSLLFSISMQSAVVLFQNRKKGLAKIVKEMFIVLTGMKAPWDAYRVAIGVEQDSNTMLTPFMELTYSKVAEVRQMRCAHKTTTAKIVASPLTSQSNRY